MSIFSLGTNSNKLFVAFAVACIVCIVYFPSIHFSYTELDDTVFIKENAPFNKDLKNLPKTFTRGVFSESKDAYYRPVLLQSFIVNYYFSKDNAAGYHLFNIALHALCCILLFCFLLACNIQEHFAFVLALIFAVHPMLVQAVSWIPGRNDSLLLLFVLIHLLVLKRSFERQSWVLFAGSFAAALAALFTKETALFVVFAGTAWVWLFVPVADKKLAAKWMAGAYAICIVIWAAMRLTASLDSSRVSLSEMVCGFFPRSLVIVQYLGKWFLPFHLSVFPTIQDTPNWPGLLVVAAAVLGYWYFRRDITPHVTFGLSWFLLFVLPALVLPSSLNDQTFEHRMYLPSVGLLLALGSMASRIEKWKKQVMGLFLCVLPALILINVRHQKNFNDPLSFWSHAIKTTPNSAYAQIMFAARISKSDPELGLAHMKKAYRLNPKEKYVNYYLGKYYLEKDSIAIASSLLYEELNHSDYYDLHFQLSKLEFLQKNLDKSIAHMENYLSKKPNDMQAFQNYLLMLRDTKQEQRAKAAIEKFEQRGIAVPTELKNLFR